MVSHMNIQTNLADSSPRKSIEAALFKTQYLKMRDNYENKILELSIIKELVDTLRLTGTDEKRVLFAEQIKIIKKYKSLEQIILILLNDDLQTIEVAAADGEEEMIGRMTYRQLDEGTLGQVIHEKRPLLINDVDESCLRAEQNFIRGRSLYCIPLLHNKNVIGVFIVAHRLKNGFDNNQINFFSLVADQIATAVVLSEIYSKMTKEEGQRFLLSRFFSKSVSETILESKDAVRLGGKRRMATIIFADLHGFTSIAERLDDEKVVEILNAFFSRMTPIIFKNDGTLDKLLGDGMMAIFGAPISHEDDPVRALRTAIEMIKVLHVFNEENRLKDWPKLKMGIGINTGSAVAGYIGSEYHLNYTVIGDAVNVASRIQSISEEDEILMTRAVKEAIGDRLSEVPDLKGLTLLPPQKIKGKKEPVDVYRVEL
jgi:class 3 adenylate cyclase